MTDGAAYRASPTRFFSERLRAGGLRGGGLTRGQALRRTDEVDAADDTEVVPPWTVGDGLKRKGPPKPLTAGPLFFLSGLWPVSMLPLDPAEAGKSAVGIGFSIGCANRVKALRATRFFGGRV
jgi:hypothetical protein